MLRGLSSILSGFLGDLACGEDSEKVLGVFASMTST